MSIQNEIQRISTNISAAYGAVEEKGGVLPEERNSANLAAAIHGIASGGGGTPLLDPVEVYKNSRPADWLPMPAPKDDEIYLLLHIPDGVSSLLAFTATCTGNYTVETGTVANGEFVPSGSTGIASGAKYETELFADDFGGLTGNGLKQVMVKISGTDILTWGPAAHSKKASPASFASWNIVEIACRLPAGTKVACGNSTQNMALKALRYVSWYGMNHADDMSNMFSNCYSLTAIPELNTEHVTSMSNMFYSCYSLTAIPELNTEHVTNMSNMFNNCYSLTAIPEMKTEHVTDMSNMFSYCYSLTAIPELDTGNVASMNYMFSNCHSLTAIPELDTEHVTSMNNMFSNCYSLAAIPALNTEHVTSMNNMFSYCYSLAAIPALAAENVTSTNNMFSGCYSLTAISELNIAHVTSMSNMLNSCYSLAKLTLAPTMTGWAGCAISLQNCSFTHEALVELFNSLPTITAAQKLTLTGNPGVSELTDAEKAIATGKNWTLTL